MYPSSITPDCGRPWKKISDTFLTHAWELWNSADAGVISWKHVTPTTHFICGQVGCKNRLILIKLDHNSGCITGEELLRGNAELDFFVYLVGQVRSLHSCPPGAETSLQGYPFHVLRNIQQLQNIDLTGCKRENKSKKKKRKMLCVHMLKWKSSWKSWGRIRWWQHAFNDVRVTGLCCLAHLNTGCNCAEEQGLVWLEAALKLPASQTQKQWALLGCGGRWPDFMWMLLQERRGLH